MAVNFNRWEKPSLASIKVLREKVLDAYKARTGINLEITLAKGSKSYSDLRDEILIVTKTGISEGTLLKFFTDNENTNFHAGKILAIKKYVEIVFKEHPEFLTKYEKLENHDGNELQDDFIRLRFSEYNFNILILPFHNPEDSSQKSLAGLELKRRLTENEYFKQFSIVVEYLPLDYFDFSSTMARNIGMRIRHVNVVIWGTDSKPLDKPHYIYFHYLLLRNLGEDDDFTSEVSGKAEIELPRLSDLYEGAIKLDLDDLVYWFIAHKYFCNDEYQKALENINKIQNSDVSNEGVYLIQAISLYELRQYEKCEDSFLKGLEINPCSPMGNYYYGNFLLTVKNDYKSAVCYFGKLINEAPENYMGYLMKAVCLDELKEIEEARNNYLKAIELEPEEFRTHFFYALFLYYQFDYENAKKYFKKTLAFGPNFYFPYFKYAQFLLNTNSDVNEAILLCEKAISIKPNSGKAYALYAELLRKENRNIEAKRAYMKATELMSGNENHKLKYSGFN